MMEVVVKKKVLVLISYVATRSTERVRRVVGKKMELILHYGRKKHYTNKYGARRFDFACLRKDQEKELGVLLPELGLCPKFGCIITVTSTIHRGGARYGGIP